MRLLQPCRRPAAPLLQLPLLLVLAVSGLVQETGAFSSSSLFGRRTSTTCAASAAAGSAPAGSSKGVVGRLLDKVNPLRIQDYQYVGARFAYHDDHYCPLISPEFECTLQP